jgi:hypothetical protein
MSALSLCQFTSVCRSKIRPFVIDPQRYLDAGEGGLLLFAVAFGGEGDEAVN